MASIRKNVTIIGITEFTRENHHIPAKFGPIVQNFLAITMRDSAGNLYVNYTEENTGFARTAKLNDTLEIQATLKETRNDEFGLHNVVTHCRMVTVAQKTLEAKKNAKRENRLRKLGLL